MVNCLAPGYLKLFYTSNAHDHTMTLPVKPASVAPSFLLNKKGGGTISQSDAIAALWDVIKLEFTDADILSGWEAYTQLDCVSAPVFQNNGTAVGLVGTNVGANVPWCQALETFKSSAGGRGKFTMIEPVQAVDQKFALDVGGGGNPNAIAAYLTGADSWVAARDGGWLSVALNFVTKTNDQLRKKYLNP